MAAQPAGDPRNVVPIRPDITPPGPEPGARRPVIPAPLQRANLAGTIRHNAGLAWHRARYHGLRSPAYLLIVAWHVARGAVILTARTHRWVTWPHGWELESAAVAKGPHGHAEAMAANKRRLDITRSRLKVLAAATAAVLVVLLAAARYAPWPVWVVAGAAVAGVLAWHGKPQGSTVVHAAVVPARYEVPTPQVITRALGSLGIKAVNDTIAGRGLAFLTDVHRDGDGWAVDLDLPHGVTARMILARREQLSAGLRRPLSAVWPEGVPHEHEGRLRLWIGFTDLASAPLRPWPLLRAGQADVFGPVPFATDPRGRPVSVPLFEANWLIGAAPGEGKTSAVRVLAAAAALDPVCDVQVHELAGKGDLEPLAQVCHRYCSGLDGDAVAYAAESLRLLRGDLGRRSGLFRQIPREQRPDGKLTRDLAADKRLRPVVAVFDECQNLLQHPQYGGQAADDAAYVARLGRAYGIVLVLATQRPSAESVPTTISGVVTARFCLKVPDQPANDAILGTGAYRAGFSAVAFRHEVDAGLGWLRGAGDPQAVRTYYLDLPATARVAARARVLRGHAGVLSGHALGLDDSEPGRDVTADLLSVFRGEQGLQWAEAAARLAQAFPGRWDGTTGEAVSAECRDRGVPSVDVRAGGTVRKGCRRRDVEAARR